MHLNMVRNLERTETVHAPHFVTSQQTQANCITYLRSIARNMVIANHWLRYQNLYVSVVIDAG